jgi:hypothetical protein
MPVSNWLANNGNMRETDPGINLTPQAFVFMERFEKGTKRGPGARTGLLTRAMCVSSQNEPDTLVLLLFLKRFDLFRFSSGMF